MRKDGRLARPLTSNNGNDRVMTPLYLAKIIVNHFKPEGKILEPCCGTGNFLKVIPTADWYEIDKGKDFLSAIGKWDWIITNPPYSKYRDFLKKSMEVADNIVFLQLINATFYKARLRDIREKNFSIVEIWCIDTPKEFPQFGFQMGCIYYRRDYKGNIKISYPQTYRQELKSLEWATKYRPR
jgi:hypothetical protein